MCTLKAAGHLFTKLLTEEALLAVEVLRDFSALDHLELRRIRSNFLAVRELIVHTLVLLSRNGCAFH